MNTARVEYVVVGPGVPAAECGPPARPIPTAMTAHPATAPQAATPEITRPTVMEPVCQV